MSGTFDDIEVYPEVDLRCSVCGATGVVEWFNASLSPQVRRFAVNAVRCPNGPHRLTLDEMKARQAAEPVRPAPADPGWYSERGLPPKRRRWWSR